MHQFSGQGDDEKISFLFKVYDLNGELKFYRFTFKYISYMEGVLFLEFIRQEADIIISVSCFLLRLYFTYCLGTRYAFPILQNKTNKIRH